MSQWKEMAGGKYPQMEEVNDLIQMRKDNTKIKIELQTLSKNIKQRQIEVNRLKQQNSTHISTLNYVQQKLQHIYNSLSIEERDRERNGIKGKNLETVLGLIEGKIKQVFEVYHKITKEKENMKNNIDNTFQQIKDIQINQNSIKKELHAKDILIKQLEAEVIRLNALLSEKTQESKQTNVKIQEYQQKIIALQADIRNLQLQLGKTGSNNMEESIQKDCLKLLDKITITSDDYLKKYLRNHNLFQDRSDQVSKKNKYQFIFDT